MLACMWQYPEMARCRSTRRWRRAIGYCFAALALAAVLTGCTALAAALRTSTALGNAGYHNVNVNVSTGAGLPAGGVVRVSYSSGPTGDDQEDAARAEHIVWDSYAPRFGSVTIVRVSGGCAGPVCATQSQQIAGATYAQLRSELGPRPRGLNATSPLSGLSIPRWVIVIAVVFVVSGIATLVVILRRYGRPPSGPGGPGGALP